MGGFLVLAIIVGVVMLWTNWDEASEFVRSSVIEAPPTPVPPPPPEINTAEIEMWVLRLTNERRSKPLRHNPKISEIARQHSEKMAERKSRVHWMNGRGPDERAKEAGYNCGLGENIIEFRGVTPSWGSEEIARHLVESWMESPGHLLNIINPEYLSTGVGIAVGDDPDPDVPWDVIWGTQNFSLCAYKSRL